MTSFLNDLSPHIGILIARAVVSVVKTPPQYLGSISSTLIAAFTCTDPKSAKRQSHCQSFLCFWDLGVQKLLVECWWNWHLVCKFVPLPCIVHEEDPWNKFRIDVIVEFSQTFLFLQFIKCVEQWKLIIEVEKMFHTYMSHLDTYILYFQWTLKWLWLFDTISILCWTRQYLNPRPSSWVYPCRSDFRLCWSSVQGSTL